MTSSNSFAFEYTDLRLDTNPTIPEWVDEIPILVHPNDRRSLVKIINVFGQDVQLSDVPSGTILLYLYSDGSVIKSFK